MISEKVRITVVMNSGRKFQKLVTIESDGSYFQVDNEIRKIVDKDFSPKDCKFFWSYV